MTSLQTRTTKGDLVEFSPKNQRTVRMVFYAPESEVTKILDDEGDIYQVSCGDMTVTRGNHVYVKGNGGPVPFKVAEINKNNERSGVANVTFEVNSTYVSKAKYFILPMLGGPKRSYYAWTEHLVDVFVGDDTSVDFSDDHNILLLYRFSGEQSYLSLEESLKSDELFLESYDVDRYHVMFCFQVPDHYMDEFDKFLEGQYSQLHHKYKKHILDFHGEDNKSALAGILHRREDYKKSMEQKYDIDIPEGAELASIPYMSREKYQEEMRIKDPIKAPKEEKGSQNEGGETADPGGPGNDDNNDGAGEGDFE